jgi:hypothetical protein
MMSQMSKYAMPSSTPLYHNAIKTIATSDDELLPDRPLLPPPPPPPPQGSGPGARIGRGPWELEEWLVPGTTLVVMPAFLSFHGALDMGV